MKYLGLLVLKEVLEKRDKKQISQYKQYIVQCFNSEDPSIKNRALEIIKVTVILFFSQLICLIDSQRKLGKSGKRNADQPSIISEGRCLLKKCNWNDSWCMYVQWLSECKQLWVDSLPRHVQLDQAWDSKKSLLTTYFSNSDGNRWQTRGRQKGIYHLDVCTALWGKWVAIGRFERRSQLRISSVHTFHTLWISRWPY